MARPVKSRKVCHYPEILEYYPCRSNGNNFMLVLTVDEYEVIRLIDLEGCSQEMCSEFMGVARTTIQRIYESARKKIAQAMVQGYSLKIKGGDFWICDGSSPNCDNLDCYKSYYHKKYKKQSGSDAVRIAVPYENGRIYQNYEHTETLKIYDIINGELVREMEVDTKEKESSALSGILTAMNVDVLICGGIAKTAQIALAASNIQIHKNVSGLSETAVNEYITKILLK